MWSRGSAPLPMEAAGADSEAAARIAAAGAEALGQTVEVAVRGYQEGSSARERAAEPARLVHDELGRHPALDARHPPARAFRPVRRPRPRPATTSTTSCPGILLAFGAGGASVVSRNKSLDRWLAVPFGTGVALTLDESALLLKLDDVYWTEEGIVSVQISLAVVSMLSALVLALRMLRRGERVVLEDG